MITNQEDIAIVFSGGADNKDPNQSLGGAPSSHRIRDNFLNNLFSDVLLPTNAARPLEDHRCFYIFNDGPTTLHSFRMAIEEERGGGLVELGVKYRTDSQRIVLDPVPSGGTLVVSYQDYNLAVTTSNGFENWTAQLRERLLNLRFQSGEKILAGLELEPAISGQRLNLNLSFGGTVENERPSDYRNMDAFSAQHSQVNAQSFRILNGAPVNTIAPSLSQSTEIPPDVVFFKPDMADSFYLPRLLPSDGFPVWVKRRTEPDAPAKESDGFSLFISATVLPEK